MKAYGLTDQGCVRAENQDRFRIHYGKNYGVAVLCDGMGGARAGSLAAELATDSFMLYLQRCMLEKEPPEVGIILRESASYANIRVYDKSRESEQYEGMGCTLVSALVQNGNVTLINIGDSRCYHFSRRGLRRLTVDHSLVEELVRAGKISREEAKTHPQKNVITQAVGLEYRLHGDIYYPEVKEGDTLLLCSDGLSNMLEKKTMENVLYDCPDIEKAAKRLMSLALRAGASDNVTVVLLRI